MRSIFDVVTAKEIASYYNTLASNKIPYLGQVLFPARKQLGLDLKWIKGSKGLPVVLKPAAFDTRAVLRDRVGFKEVQTEMPFFKEAMMVKEVDRQELNRVIAAGNQTYIDLIVNKIFDDQLTLVDGAKAQAERMRMQLLYSGKIAITANGVALDYDYHLKAARKGDAKFPWSDADKAVPLTDLLGWMDTVEDETGVRPTRAIMTRKTWGWLLANKSIRMDMNVYKGQNIVLTDTMLDQYLVSKIGLKVQLYNKKFMDETGTQQPYYPDGTITLLPEGTLGNSWYGTTPEESDLMNGAAANVSIVETGVAVTTVKKADPVNVETKVSMITIPSFERIDEVFIANVGGEAVADDSGAEE